MKFNNFVNHTWDFPGDPVVDYALPLQGTGSIPGQGTSILQVIWLIIKEKRHIIYLVVNFSLPVCP